MDKDKSTSVMENKPLRSNEDIVKARVAKIMGEKPESSEPEIIKNPVLAPNTEVENPKNEDEKTEDKNTSLSDEVLEVLEAMEKMDNEEREEELKIAKEKTEPETTKTPDSVPISLPDIKKSSFKEWDKAQQERVNTKTQNIVSNSSEPETTKTPIPTSNTENENPENQEPVLSPEGIPVVDKIDRLAREADIDSAIQRVLIAEDEFEKRKKSKKKFDGLVSQFKLVLNSKDEKKEKKDNATREYNEAEAEKDQAKKDMDELIKGYARGDIEGGRSEFEIKMAMLDDKDKLDNKRIESQPKSTQGWIKKGLEKWHKQGILKQVAITGAFIMGGEALIAFGGLTAIVGGTMVAGMATLEAVATATGVEKMIGSGQKWYRKKHGMTKEAKTEEARKEFVGEEEDDEQGIENLLKNFDQHDIDLNKKLGEVFKVEHRDKIIRWTVAVAAGLAVGGLRASHAIAKMKKGMELGGTVATKGGTGRIPSEVRAVNEEKLAEIVGQGTKEVEKIGPRVGKIPLPPIESIKDMLNKDIAKAIEGIGEGTGTVANSTKETLGSLAKQVAESPDKFKAVVKAGSSQWETAEGVLSKVEGLGFNNMTPERQAHFIDSIIEKVGKTDMVKAGEKIDFSKALGNKGFMEKLISRNKEIVDGTKEFANIAKNNASIKEWAIKNPGKALNTETVKGIISGGKNVIDKAAVAGETFATSLEKIPTSAVAATKEATFEAIKEIGVNVKKIPEFAGEMGVWAQTSDMSVYKFMEDSAKGAIEMTEKVGGVSNAVSKRAMTGEETKVIKLLRDYVIKIGDSTGKNPEKGQTIMQYINAFRKGNGVAPYNKLGILNKLGATASKVKPVLAGPL